MPEILVKNYNSNDNNNDDVDNDYNNNNKYYYSRCFLEAFSIGGLSVLVRNVDFSVRSFFCVIIARW